MNAPDPRAAGLDVFRHEITALEAVADRLGADFDRAVAMLRDRKGKIVVTGLGKSGRIGQKIAATFSSTGSPALFLNAAEALHGDIGVVSRGDVVIMITNSATTPEYSQMLPSLRRLGVNLLGLFGKTDTPLAQAVDVVLDVGVPREGSPLELVPMASATAALVMGDALAAALMAASGFSGDDFAVLHPGGSIGRKLLLRARDVMHQGDELPRVDPAATFKAVVIELTRTQLGAVCVCDEAGQLLGLVTDGDIRRGIERDLPMDTPAEDFMTRGPVTATPELPLFRVLALMEDRPRQLSQMPVVDARGQCVGLLRIHDLL